MKTTIKWIIGIALLSIQTVAYSQNFIDETKQWTIVSCYDDGYYFATTFYKFSGDSILNGISYHKLYESTDSSQVIWNVNSLWWERNDSVFQYYTQYGNSNDTSILIYDFNIEEGDSFFVKFNSYYSFYMKVDSIRNIEWGGSIRKHWFFCVLNSDSSTCNSTVWIEGVGQSRLFTLSSEGCLIGGKNHQLLCFKADNLIYQNPYFISCEMQNPYYTNCYVSVPSITKSKELINLFPNPATNYLTLNIDNVQLLPFNFQLYDMQGRLQLKGKTSATQTEINVATLPRGLYVLKIITNQQIETKKIVLQ